MKAIIVGDLHGCVEVVNLALAAAEKENAELVFLGDYVDSFTRSPEDQISTVVQLLDLVQAGKARALIGNHEMSYFSDSMRCSGYSQKTQFMMSHLQALVEQYFDTHIWLEERTLLTHAGLTYRLLKTGDDSLEGIQTGLKYDKWLYHIGHSRGGSRYPYGGTLWCDWYTDFEDIPGIKQIFGHSRPRKGETPQVFRRTEHSVCIDNIEDCNSAGMRPVVALYEDGEVKEYLL